MSGRPIKRTLRRDIATANWQPEQLCPSRSMLTADAHKYIRLVLLVREPITYLLQVETEIVHGR